MSADRIGWLLVSGAAAWAAGLAARGVLNSGWRMVAESDPPARHASGDRDWPRALAWTVASATVMAAARFAAREAAVTAWERVTGDTPPEV